MIEPFIYILDFLPVDRVLLIRHRDYRLTAIVKSFMGDGCPVVTSLTYLMRTNDPSATFSRPCRSLYPALMAYSSPLVPRNRNCSQVSPSLGLVTSSRPR